jgi:GT2 family glycosyltransferase
VGEGRYYFDPSFFAYCEDLDLGWRARLAGFTVGYADKAVVYHKGSAATKPMSDFAIYHTYRNLIWTHFKNMPLPLLLWQWPWLAAGWLFLFVLYTFKGRPGVILRALFDGLLGLRFMLKKRRAIQRGRTVSNKEILSWFITGLFPKSYLKKYDANSSPSPN